MAQEEAIHVQTRCAQQALANTGLVLDIDDFAIRNRVIILRRLLVLQSATSSNL